MDPPEHCPVNGGFPLFGWKKQHVSMVATCMFFGALIRETHFEATLFLIHTPIRSITSI